MSYQTSMRRLHAYIEACMRIGRYFKIFFVDTTFSLHTYRYRITYGSNQQNLSFYSSDPTLNVTMKSFAFLVALLALIHSSSAFTTVTTVQPRVAKTQAVAPLNMFVDMTGGSLADVPAIGSILSLVATVAIWELFDPQRKAEVAGRKKGK